MCLGIRIRRNAARAWVYRDVTVPGKPVRVTSARPVRSRRGARPQRLSRAVTAQRRDGRTRYLIICARAHAPHVFIVTHRYRVVVVFFVSRDVDDRDGRPEAGREKWQRRRHLVHRLLRGALRFLYALAAGRPRRAEDAPARTAATGQRRDDFGAHVDGERPCPSAVALDVVAVAEPSSRAVPQEKPVVHTRQSGGHRRGPFADYVCAGPTGSQ